MHVSTANRSCPGHDGAHRQRTATEPPTAYHRVPTADCRLLRMLRVNVLVIAWIAIAGCRGGDSLPSLQVYPVKGKVLLADGTPLTSGWVYFVPKSGLPITPSAQLAPDGTFSILTGGSGEGAPAGDYKVRIEAPQFGGGAKSKKSPFQFKYTDEDSSGLDVTVLAQPNQLEPFRLK
jgi:hypothetical protein